MTKRLPEGFSEADILGLAEVIKMNRLCEQKLESFYDAKTVMVRWDIPGAKFGQSYIGIDIPKSLVEEFITKYYEDQIVEIT